MTYISFITAPAVALWLLLSPALAGAQTTDQALARTLEELVEGQAAVLEELKAIRKALEQPRPQVAAQPSTAGEPAELTLRGPDGTMTKGDSEAPLVLVEYTDYQCPFCARHFADTIPSLTGEYVDTGKLRYVLRDFPLESIHPQAFQAAEAARCAGDQGQYWPMHDVLFQNQRALQPQQLEQYAERLGLDTAAFRACLEEGRQAQAVRADLDEGQDAGVRGTPTFFLAVEGDDGSLKTVQKIRGAQPYSAFKSAIDEALAGLAEAAGSG